MGLLGDNKKAGFDEGDKLSVKHDKKRVIDEEAGVVIYAVSPQDESYGLAAVPIDDTDLEIE